MTPRKDDSVDPADPKDVTGTPDAEAPATDTTDADLGVDATTTEAAGADLDPAEVEVVETPDADAEDTDADAEDTGADEVQGASAAEDDVEIVEYAAADEDEIPFELREEYATGEEPRTGLVSEFGDLTSRSAAYLVSARETSATLRSPLYYVPLLLVVLGTVTGLFLGWQQARPDLSTGSEMPTVAMVGVAGNEALFEQQYGITAVDVESVEAGQELVRAGDVDAMLVQDQSGTVPPYLLALDSEPTELVEALAPSMDVQFVDAPLVGEKVYAAMTWGFAGLLALAVVTLGGVLYANARLEKRNRIAEILAATIPPRAAAWGRVYGLTLLSVAYPVLAGGLFLLGLSIIRYASIAKATLPTLGWFAALFVLGVALFLSLYLWASTAAGRRVRQVSYGIVVVLAVAGALVPVLFSRDWDVLPVLTYIPFTSPVATAIAFLGNHAEWWQGLVSVGIVLVTALVAFLLAAGSYRRNLLRGAGKGGRTAVTKAGKKAAKKAGTSGSAKKAEAESDSDSESSKDAEADEESEEKAKA
ncbi:ABC transporter permease [Brevibacterium litoralis]|uniref:ABC transporter permease n=1 Tax=Brevibacterium litoralis TaxID=3138935 RepID=UPI0032EF6E1F